MSAFQRIFRCHELLDVITSFQPGSPQDLHVFLPLSYPKINFGTPVSQHDMFLVKLSFASVHAAIKPWYLIYGVTRLSKLVTCVPQLIDLFFADAVFFGEVAIVTLLLRLVQSTPTPLPLKRDALTVAAMNGQVDMFQHLQQWQYRNVSTNVMTWATHGGHLAMLQYLHEQHATGASAQTMDMAARNGHLHVVQ
ncbi:hypothetical protein H257_17650 [Aphanomyces astaci]|uniref:Uncharacterized protein n=1 Tax=Aphanomyces astaci TaxID=112090 RepID=W4FFR3_APHAT|nr:hypothetical protein H257_17650 [Aphanomyces astaci]ETV65709.1 hypothetical protein H257_17650 [Aphanomyces astaci]|eukprot:XP_009844816.1 hypothetical protein H257_17650 [Aphanomyces astaci]